MNAADSEDVCQYRLSPYQGHGRQRFMWPRPRAAALNWACINSSILNLDLAPLHLIVVGCSYVGLEFVQMLRRFGSHVTVIEMSPGAATPVNCLP